MRLAHLASRLYNTPLMIAPDKAHVIEEVFRQHAFGEKAAAPPDLSAAPMGLTVTPDGVAVIPIMGTLVQRTGAMDSLSGLTSYATIAAQLDAALSNPAVTSILLEIDSPGGEVNGLFDLTNAIAAANEQKPVLAIANEQAFSAAYAIASSAGELYTPRTGGVGSIGVIAMHVDQSQRDLKMGYSYTPIFAGDRKADFSSHAPLSSTARASAQGEVDRLYGMFVDHVAQARGVTSDAVRSTQAAVLSPDAALGLGLIDGIASFGEVVSRAAEAGANRLTSRGNSSRLAAIVNPPKKGNPMAETTTTPANEAAEKPAAQAGMQLPAAQTATPQIDVSSIQREARDSERARVRGILACAEATERPGLAKKLALDTDLDPISAQAVLASAAVETKPAQAINPLANAMAGVVNPKVGVSAGSDDDSAQAEAARVVAIFRQSRGEAAA